MPLFYVFFPMKEITSYASNTLALLSADGKLEPQAEIALVLCEPTYRLTSDGQLARERAVETVRFSAAPEVLRKLAARFTKTADETEAEVEAASAPAASS